jgi:hypothetical protein
MIINETKEDEIKIDGNEIEIIPLWKIFVNIKTINHKTPKQL